MNISYFKIHGITSKDKFFPAFEKTVKEMLLEKGQLPQPIACILDPSTQEMIIIFLDFSDDHKKMMSMRLIKMLCNTMGVKMFCFASEAWMAARSQENSKEITERLKNEPGFRIEQLQDRIECLIISYESTDPDQKENVQVTFQLIRDASEKLLILKELNRFDQNSKVQMSGNLMNILTTE
jgi:hypothetical protein